MTGYDAQAGLPASAEDRLRDFLAPDRRLGAVTRLPLKALVHDYSDKFIALDDAGRPAAFVIVSPASHPGVVADAVARAQAVQSALGERLGANVLVPQAATTADGRSYSIAPYAEPMSQRRLVGRWQRWRMAPRLLRWLEDAAAATKSPIADAALEPTLLAPLRRVAGDARVEPELRAIADAALADVAAGRWRPCTVVAHNDLWWGNFVSGRPARNPSAPFYVIDWGGGTPQGLPFYDLVRLAMSLELPRGRLHAALHRHVALLGCRARDVPAYLLATFGTFASDLGEWPEARYLDAMRLCVRLARDAL